MSGPSTHVPGLINDRPDTDINQRSKFLFTAYLNRSFQSDLEVPILNKRTLSRYFSDKTDFHSEIEYNRLSDEAKNRADAWYDECFNIYGGKRRTPKKTRKSRKARKSKKSRKHRK
jgi:hypothetical protein